MATPWQPLRMPISYEWRGPFDNDEFHVLHAEAFETRVFDDDWVTLTDRHSLGLGDRP